MIYQMFGSNCFKRIALCLTIFSVSPCVSATSELPTLSLSQVVEKTLNHNPQLHQFGLLKQQLSSQGESQKLQPGYQVDVEVDNFLGSGDLSGVKAAELSVALSSVLELGEKPKYRYAVVEASLGKLEYERQAKTLDILGQATSVFIKALSTQHQIKLAEEALSLSTNLLETVKHRAQRGVASDAEVKRASAQLFRLQLQRDGLNREFERQTIVLARFWGSFTARFERLKGDLFAFGEGTSFELLFDKVKRSPAISALASEARVKNAELKLAQSSSRGDLGWKFGISRLQESQDFGLTAGISIPLMADSRNIGAIGAARAELDIVKLKQTDSLLRLHQQLFVAYSMRQQYIDAVKVIENKVLPELEQALLISEKAYERGRLRYQDLLSAHQELLDSKNKKIQMATSALLNQAVIEQLTAQPLTR